MWKYNKYLEILNPTTNIKLISLNNPKKKNKVVWPSESLRQTHKTPKKAKHNKNMKNFSSFLSYIFYRTLWQIEVLWNELVWINLHTKPSFLLHRRKFSAIKGTFHINIPQFHLTIHLLFLLMFSHYCKMKTIRNKWISYILNLFLSPHVMLLLLRFFESLNHVSNSWMENLMWNEIRRVTMGVEGF
jgi:hypothetical protein